MIDQQLPRSSAEMTAQTIAALAGPEPDRAALIRANAALAVAKAATLAALDLGDGRLTPADRGEVLAVALGTLKELSRTISWCLPKGHAVADFVGAIDQGTTSTRFIVFDRAAATRSAGAARAPADLSAARAGSSTTRWSSWQPPAP